MANLAYGLKLVENTVMTVAEHPAGIPKYGQAHKKLVSIYESLFGREHVYSDMKAGKLDVSSGLDVMSKVYEFTSSKKWIGANIGEQVGKHKIPRFLYHVTTRANYENMLKTGLLRVGNGGGLGYGVYMLELQNMIKHYGNNKGYRGLNRILELVRSHMILNEQGGEVVLLRIPTGKLNAGRLAIRDIGDPGNQFPLYNNITDIIGDAAINSKLYKQRKAGLEYIYPHDIDINNVTLVGSATTRPLSFGDEFLNDTEALTIWKTLTKENPEYKAFEALIGV